jgi:hypothetical protein
VLLGGLGVCGLVYLAAAKLFRLDEVDLVLGAILRRLRKRRGANTSAL